MTNNLTQAVLMIVKFRVTENIWHEDIDAFGAPSECHDLLNLEYSKRWMEAARPAIKLAGSARALREASIDMKQHNRERLYHQLFAKMSPFGGQS